jgi:hypothetical protein
MHLRAISCPSRARRRLSWAASRFALTRRENQPAKCCKPHAGLALFALHFDVKLTADGQSYIRIDAE